MLNNVHSVLCDASSFIYLNQANLIGLFLENIKIYTTDAVLKEISHKSDGLYELILKSKVKTISSKEKFKRLHKLSDTDSELVYLSKENNYVILTDDGKISRYCYINDLRHLNSLTAVIVLFERDVIDLKRAYFELEKISKIGRYSKDVIRYAFSLLP